MVNLLSGYLQLIIVLLFPLYCWGQQFLILTVSPEEPIRYQNIEVTWTVGGESFSPNNFGIDHFQLTIVSLEGPQATEELWQQVQLPPNARSFKWRVDCGVPMNSVLQLTLLAFDSSQFVIGQASTTTGIVQNNQVCFGPVATFINTGGNTVEALSKPTVLVQSLISISNASVYLNGYVFCQIASVTAGQDATCTAVVPCSAIGTGVQLFVSGYMPDCDSIPDTVPTIWTVTSVLCCLPRLEIIDNCGEFVHCVTATEEFTFVLKLHPTDDYRLYENLNIFQGSCKRGPFSLVLHSDCLKPTKHCNLAKTAYIIGCYALPCYFNCLKKAIFKCLYTKLPNPYDVALRLMACSHPTSQITSATQDLTVENKHNQGCVLHFLPPKVLADQPCGRFPFVFDCCTGCWAWRVGDLVEFAIQIGCQPDTIISNFKLEVVGCKCCDSHLLFRQWEPFPPDSCGRHILTVWKIPLKFWGRSDLKIFFTYDFINCNGVVQSEKIVFKVPRIAI